MCSWSANGRSGSIELGCFLTTRKGCAKRLLRKDCCENYRERAVAKRLFAKGLDWSVFWDHTRLALRSLTHLGVRPWTASTKPLIEPAEQPDQGLDSTRRRVGGVRRVWLVMDGSFGGRTAVTRQKGARQFKRAAGLCFLSREYKPCV